MKHNLIILLFIWLSSLCGLSVSAQTGTVTGNITDSEGFPVIGASVVVKGTTNGVISDVDGNYSLSNISNGTVLLFSFVGLESQEVKYNGQSVINIVMKTSSVLLDEVVAIGYEVKLLQGRLVV